MITHGSPSFVSGPSGSSIGSRFAKSSAISSLLSSQSGCSELLFVLIYCLNFLLFRRLQLHKLVDHSFQTVEHDIIAEDKHLQSPFLLVQQHGLTGCARHVVDVLYGATCNLLTVELDNDRSCTATRFRHSLLKCVNHRCKRRFDVRSALLVAQYSKKFFVRWDDRAMCELRDMPACYIPEPRRSG